MNVTIFAVVCIVVILVGGCFAIHTLIRSHINLLQSQALTPEQILDQMYMGTAQNFTYGSSSTMLAGSRADDHHPECMICISEFIEGEEIRVLSRCKHGFHAKCIQKWLLLDQSSCPTCRTNCQKIPFNKNPPGESSQQQQNDVVHDIKTAIPSETEMVVQQQHPQPQPQQQNVLDIDDAEAANPSEIDRDMVVSSEKVLNKACESVPNLQCKSITTEFERLQFPSSQNVMLVIQP